SSLPVLSMSDFATSDSLYRLSIGKENSIQIKSFHTGTRTWRKSRWERIIESDASMGEEEESLSLPPTSHLPHAVVLQLAMLRRSSALEKAFPLGDSLLIVRSPDNLLIIQNGGIRRVKREASSARVDFAFLTSSRSILYGGVNMAKQACLQVHEASSIHEFERGVSSIDGSLPLFHRYPSSSSSSGPSDFSRALYSLHDDRLSIVVPKTKEEANSCLSILSFDISTGSMDESSLLLSSPLPSSFWSSRRSMWNDQVVSLVDHTFITVHIKTGAVNGREVDPSVNSFALSPFGEVFLLSSSDLHSSSYLTAPLLSSLARDSVLNKLQYSFRMSIPSQSTDAKLVHAVLS
ncbi:hypothetical protein PMAYCL1PPCAC_29451, partial [Pristionchus mayeri]